MDVGSPRVQQGRDHLAEGSLALGQGFAEDALRQFGAALVRFRGPDLRLGEAHALRGMAQANLAIGNLVEAERLGYQALRAYVELSDAAVLVLVSTEAARWQAHGVSGEAACWALLGEVHARCGRWDDVHEALERSQLLLARGETDGALAGAWLQVGRVAARSRRPTEAREALLRALRIATDVGDAEGVIAARVALANLEMQEGGLDLAASHLGAALRESRALEHEAWEARVRCAMAALSLREGQFAQARMSYGEALHLARRAGDGACEAHIGVGLGLVASGEGDARALALFVRAATFRWEASDTRGFAEILLHLADATRRASHPRLSLLSAELARRVLRAADPMRGQGQALRRLVVALHQARRPREAFLASLVRESVARDDQPQAADVAAWFFERAPYDLLKEAGQMSVDDMVAEVERAVEAELPAGILGDMDRALDLIRRWVSEMEEEPPRRLPGSVGAAVDVLDLGAFPELPLLTQAPTPVPAIRVGGVAPV